MTLLGTKMSSCEGLSVFEEKLVIIFLSSSSFFCFLIFCKDIIIKVFRYTMRGND